MANSTLTLTHDDALSVLEYWHSSAERLMLVQSKAGERVTRIGHGCVRDATSRELRIDTDYGRLRVAMHSAAFEFGVLAKRAACSRGTRSEGLLIRSELDGWVFLRATSDRQPIGERVANPQSGTK